MKGEWSILPYLTQPLPVTEAHPGVPEDRGSLKPHAQHHNKNASQFPNRIFFSFPGT